MTYGKLRQVFVWRLSNQIQGGQGEQDAWLGQFWDMCSPWWFSHQFTKYGEHLFTSRFVITQIQVLDWVNVMFNDFYFGWFTTTLIDWDLQVPQIFQVFTLHEPQGWPSCSWNNWLSGGFPHVAFASLWCGAFHRLAWAELCCRAEFCGRSSIARRRHWNGCARATWHLLL